MKMKVKCSEYVIIHYSKHSEDIEDEVLQIARSGGFIRQKNRHGVLYEKERQ